MSLARPARTLLGRCPNSLPQPVVAAQMHCRQHQHHHQKQAHPQSHPQHHSRRQFHSTPAARGSNRSRFKNITAEKMGLIKGTSKLDQWTQQKFPDYSDEDLDQLRETYTPGQMEAIRAAEAAIDPEDFTLQGRMRDDRHRPGYFDDFATVQPVIDLKTELKATPEPVRWLSHDQWAHDFIDGMSKRVEKRLESKLAGTMANALRRVKQTVGDMIDVTEEELQLLEQNPKEAERLLEAQVMKDRMMREAENPGVEEEPELTDAQVAQLSFKIDKEFFTGLHKMFEPGQPNPLEPTKLELWKEVDGSGDRRTSALSAKPKRIPGLESLYQSNNNDEAQREDNPEAAEQLLRTTGLHMADIKRLVIKPLHSSFVSNQTRLGKIGSLRVIMMAGNGDGWLGIGIGKSTDSTTAMLMARLLAVRNMRPIRRYENRTVYGNLRTKISGTIVELNTRPPGYGLRASYRIFEMCRAVGIHDLGARITRSRNPMNTVKAAYQCLLNQPNPDEIAIGRGLKMVDCRKVYWGGNVL